MAAPELDALEHALAETPENVALRLYVARQYLVLAEGTATTERAGMAASALGHARHILGQRPAHREALGVAARAARLTGDAGLAEGYEQLAAALPGEAPDAGPGRAPPAFAPDGSHDDLEGEAPLYLAVENAETGAPSLREVYVPDVRLADVGGLDSVKQRLTTSFLAPLQNPELRRMYRKSLRGGLLLYGPPGCGKTFLARALAGELQAQFFSVGLHEILDMWLGNSEKNLHELFETARRNRPCVLFLDEVDALGFRRSRFAGGAAGRNVVAQLLAEMDGLRDENDGVFMVGATNQPWDLDPALRRPGRFDRMVLVVPPDEPARVSILHYHLRDRPLAPDLDVRPIAARTEGFSGADLRLVCEAAAEAALADAVSSGRARPVTTADLVGAAKAIVPSTRAWFDSAKNVVQFADEGGRYDDLREYLRTRRWR